MLKFATIKNQEMINALNELPLLCENQLQIAERSYGIIQAIIKQLNEYLLSYSFKDKAEEIEYFKNTKPKFLRELKYHKEVYHIEANKPKGSIELITQHYKYELERMRIYFDRNQELYNYYRMSKTMYDELYFLRNTVNEYNAIENAVDIDHRCCTLYSMKLSKLQAYEMVSDYLQNCLYKIDNPGWMPTASIEHKTTVTWTDAKNDLIELAYGLHAKGSINHGKADIKQIVSALEWAFNSRVGNFYRSFQNMKIRKKNITPFIDGIKTNLIRWMSEE